MKTSNVIFYFLCFFIVVIVYNFIYYSTSTIVEATVTDKQIVVTGTKDATESTYLIFTDKEVFENEDLIFIGKFNSSDFYAQIHRDKKYKFTVYGWRIPFLSMYRNISKFEEVK